MSQRNFDTSALKRAIAVVSAALGHEPRAWRSSVRLLRSRVVGFQQSIARAQKSFSALDEDERSEFWRASGLGSEQNVRYVSLRLTKLLDALINIESSADAYKHSVSQFVDSALFWLGSFKDSLEPPRLWFDLDVDYEDAFLSLEGMYGRDGWLAQKGKPTAERAIVATKQLNLFAKDWFKDIESSRSALTSAFERWAGLRTQRRFDSHTGDRLPPKSETTEILYHATVNAKRIKREGFQPKVPAREEGLGGSNKDKAGNPAIAFTSDLYVAKEIARCLKEMIGIARGDYLPEQLEHDLLKENVLQQVLRMFGGQKTGLETKEDAMQAYLYWLAIGERYNPVFMAGADELVRRLSAFRESDVGVISAIIDMSNADIAYYSSMHEYRVPPSAVLSIKALVR